MDIHEYQAKELLASSACRCPRAAWPTAPSRRSIARDRDRRLRTGRSRRRSIRRPRQGRRHQAVQDRARGARRRPRTCSASGWSRIQTGPEGKPVQRSISRRPSRSSASSISASCSTARAERIMVVIASQRGGMEIEEIAKNEPETIIRVVVEPAVGHAGLPGARARLRARPRARAGAAARSTTHARRYRAFRDLDATMVEINPLVVTKDGRVLALDAKMTFDDNALFRRPQRRRAARHVAGGPARGAGRRARSQLCRRSTARSAASSTAPASPWRPWT